MNDIASIQQPVAAKPSMPSTHPSVPQLDAANLDPLKDTKFDFARDFIGYGRQPPNASWPNGAKIAVSFVINYEEGAERTVQNGDATSEPFPLGTIRYPSARGRTLYGI